MCKGRAGGKFPSSVSKDWTQLIQEWNMEELIPLWQKSTLWFWQNGLKGWGYIKWSDGRHGTYLRMWDLPSLLTTWSPASQSPPPGTSHFISAQQSLRHRNLFLSSCPLSLSDMSDPTLHAPYPLFLSPPFTQVLFSFSIPAHPYLQPSFLQSTILTTTNSRQKDFPCIMLTHHGHGTEPILQFTLLWALFSFSPSQDGADSPNLLPGFLPLVSTALPCSQMRAVLCPLQMNYGSSGCTSALLAVLVSTTCIWHALFTSKICFHDLGMTVNCLCLNLPLTSL